MWLTFLVNCIYFFENAYKSGFGLGFGDSVWKCGEMCGKVGKWWVFAVGFGKGVLY